MTDYSTVPEAVEALKAGKVILVIDDPDRENEGDFICAAQYATTENVNFMASHAKGLICMPMSEEYVRKLQLPQMVAHNTDNHETAFTVSIDHVNTTTGISAEERGYTARMSASTTTPRRTTSAVPATCSRCSPRKDGVLERNGHTEATVDLLQPGRPQAGAACAARSCATTAP